MVDHQRHAAQSHACGGASTNNSDRALSPDQPEVASSPANPSEASPTPSPSDAPAPSAPAPTPAAASAPAPSTAATPASTQTLAAKSSSPTQEVTVYKLDNQCEDFVAQKMTMPQADLPNQVVGKVIENSNGPDFKIENYRIQIENGTATIDLRLPPGAKRPFAAMSTCEQRSLLGSMQKTLTSNPKLKINSVRFTDGKEELVF